MIHALRINKYLTSFLVFFRLKWSRRRRRPVLHRPPNDLQPPHLSPPFQVLHRRQQVLRDRVMFHGAPLQVLVHKGKSQLGTSSITFNPSNATATLVKAQDFWKPSKPCHVGIHLIALAEYSQMSTHVPGFHHFCRFFASFYLATSGIRVNIAADMNHI